MTIVGPVENIILMAFNTLAFNIIPRLHQSPKALEGEKNLQLSFAEKEISC